MAIGKLPWVNHYQDKTLDQGSAAERAMELRGAASRGQQRPRCWFSGLQDFKFSLARTRNMVSRLSVIGDNVEPGVYEKYQVPMILAV